MNEKEKIEEAKYFYKRMIQELDTYKSFAYNLSAFLSAARSVLQYAREEAIQKNKGQAWYDKQINKSPILKYFKCKRDFNVHELPIKPTKGIKVKVRCITVKIPNKKSGNKVKIQSRGKVTSEHEYKFDDWRGTEDVLKLCELYIDELEKLVNDGISKGIITG